MIAFLTADGNLPFAIALLVMLIIAVLEGITTVLGAGLSSLLEGALPDMDVDIDTPDLDSNGGVLSSLLGWLRVGEVPVLILLVVFLTGFGLIGLGIQSFIEGATGSLLSWPVAAVPALVLSLPLVRVLGGILGRVMPKDETDAISRDALVGRVAVITLGTARVGHPAEARTRDTNGTTHYVMVEPLEEGQTLTAGTEVLIIEPAGAGFRAVKADSALLD
jgi:hypothetical protein